MDTDFDPSETRIKCMDIDSSSTMSKKRSAIDSKAGAPKVKKATAMPKEDINNQSAENLTSPSSSQLTPKPFNMGTSIQYIKSDIGPYKAVVTFNNSKKDGPEIKPSLDVEVSRVLLKMGVNFSLLKRVSRFKWIVTFNNKDAANMALTNQYVMESNKYSISIPWYMIYRKVVIKGISIDVSEEEIWKELKESNPKLIFDREDIFRLKIRKFVDGVATYVDSTSVKLNLRATSIPSHAIM